MRKLAITGGLGYVVIFITGIFANFSVLEKLKVAGDPTATYQNFAGNQSLVVMALIAFLLMVIFDVVLTWVLCKMFKEQDARLSKVTAGFRLVNALIFGAALYHLTTVLTLISNPSDISYGTKELSLALVGFNDVWLIGLVFFGVHLILLSVLLKRSGRVYRAIPSLLFIAGVGYILDTALQFGYSDYSNIAEVSTLVVVLPGLIGELSLTAWLLFKAGSQRELNSQCKLCAEA